MWFKKLFNGLSERKVIQMMRERGSLVGSRDHAGRKIYIYMIKGFFAQVMFRQDDPVEDVEYIQTFEDINQLNSHLEQEFKSAFLATR
ncbi:MAG TPA: hypothetical protein VG737_05635 [Cyclobacteriaceae bacterium]|nr:hypothetical protein [Cyclobacteriaceae bacterium]